MQMICEICGRLFVSLSNLNQHRREQHDSNLLVFNCDFCQKLFARKYNLRRHLKTVHNCENMNHQRRTVCRNSYMESRKPVYVHSDLYDDISSDENEEMFCDFNVTESGDFLE